jgi:hypothetical protein
VLISRSSSDSATAGLAKSGYQSLGARLLVRTKGLPAIARSETRSLIVGLGGGVLTHREVIDDQCQRPGVFALALTDGAIGVATGQIGEHAGAFDEPDVPASACYVMPECLCHMGFAYPRP